MSFTTRKLNLRQSNNVSCLFPLTRQIQCPISILRFLTLIYFIFFFALESYWMIFLFSTFWKFALILSFTFYGCLFPLKISGLIVLRRDLHLRPPSYNNVSVFRVLNVLNHKLNLYLYACNSAYKIQVATFSLNRRA